MAKKEQLAGRLTIHTDGSQELVVTDAALDAFAFLAGYEGEPPEIGKKLKAIHEREGQKRYQELFSSYALGINFLKEHKGGFSTDDLLELTATQSCLRSHSRFNHRSQGQFSGRKTRKPRQILYR
ncbi:hypothetical protein A2721_01825 [Candidatus Gottesmanbacteria bacterium RIFCSPHIGHO2_01_FULL_47_48]|uniref:Uncharacterized protein n=1 Tax=Candidatus Gottesmanbacteria bacterium RIFCSPHIGHO2_01_FULL_47_48 TaxID=1798381 RepID=A0A1F6A1F6_9BACT|nr:MAG: hypothetical protein A2721_01825 [Candidatus Gottesmanbacteria bacterium RIFCSPHIGHO2_01_FULL_47_48]